MESKKFLIKKLYENEIVGECEDGFKCNIKPSLLTDFFELDKTYKVWCVKKDNFYEIHSIHNKISFLFVASSVIEYLPDMHDKLEKFGAYYNVKSKSWQIDSHIMGNKEYVKEIKEILPCIMRNEIEI